jgi:hypothetical protein
MLATSAGEVHGSNLGQGTSYSSWGLLLFPQATSQILEYYLDSATTVSFRILTPLSVIRHYTVWILKASLNNPPPLKQEYTKKK